MFRVRVMLSLWARNGVMGLSRWLSLPFAPFPGLGLYGLTSEPDRAEVVETVAWDAAENCFHAELLDCTGGDETLSELIDYYGAAWELHEPGSQPVPEP
jgi:hypothetical protein